MAGPAGTPAHAPGAEVGMALEVRGHRLHPARRQVREQVPTVRQLLARDRLERRHVVVGELAAPVAGMLVERLPHAAELVAVGQPHPAVVVDHRRVAGDPQELAQPAMVCWGRRTSCS